jgi:hypothetical protein
MEFYRILIIDKLILSECICKKVRACFVTLSGSVIQFDRLLFLHCNFLLQLHTLQHMSCDIWFLGLFAKLWRATVSFIMSICPSIRSAIHLSASNNSTQHSMDFREIWYLSIFRKSVKKIQVSLNSDKSSGYFTWRPMYTFGPILHLSS